MSLKDQLKPDSSNPVVAGFRLGTVALADTVNVRYMVDDVAAAVDFYTAHLGFTSRTSTLPAFADVTRGNLRRLLSGPDSSAGRPMPDGAVPVQVGGTGST